MEAPPQEETHDDHGGKPGNNNKIRVMVFKNAMKKRDGRVLLIDDTMAFPDFLQAAGNKHKMRNIKRAFNANGEELQSVSQITNGSDVFITDGADFLCTACPNNEATADLPNINWVTIEGGGRFSVYHRPKHTHFAHLKKEGCTHIVTLLCAKERAEAIGTAAERQGLKWIWLPLPNAEPPPNNELDRIETGLREMAHAILRDKGTILIHCSAGIHRTGMITNTLLLYLGLRQDEALEKLAQARQVTADGVGQKRLDWGQVFIDAKGTYNK